MDGKLSSILKNYSRLTGGIWCDRGTSDENARVLADSCLKAIEVCEDVVIANEYLRVARTRLEGSRPVWRPEVLIWAEAIIADTQVFITETEKARR